MLFTEVPNKEELCGLIVSELREEFGLIGVKYRKEKKHKNTADNTTKRKIFSTPLYQLELTNAVLSNGAVTQVPVFVSDACERILENVTTVGLFRRSGSVQRQKEIRANLERGIPLNRSHQALDVANILKLFFRELPDPIIPNGPIQETMLRSLMCGENKVRVLLLTCLLLPPLSLNTLAYFMQFLHTVAQHADENRMNAENLGILFTPGLMPLDNNNNVRLHNHFKIIQLLIENSHDIGLVPESIKAKARLQLHLECDVLSVTGVLAERGGGDRGDNKKKKKRRSGSLTRMFNGLKKIVGGGRDSTESLDKVSELPNPMTPCLNKAAKKRKVAEMGVLSAKKKKEVLSALPQNNGGLLPNTPIVPPKETKRSRLSLGGHLGRSRAPKTTSNSKKDDLQPPMERRWSVVGSGWNRKKQSSVASLLEVSSSISKPSTIDKTPANSMDSILFPSQKLQNSTTVDYDVLDASPKIRISKSEYEAIKDRVSAIENRISQEFSNIHMIDLNTSEQTEQASLDGPEKVLNKYNQTLAETEPITESATSTDQLAKRLSRELKIRRSCENKVIRSPSARKIGTLRRRSKESVRLSRNMSWHKSGTDVIPNVAPPVIDHSFYPKSSLKRGRPNTTQTGLRQPTPNQDKTPVTMFATSPMITGDGKDAQQWICADDFFSNPSNDEHNMSIESITPTTPVAKRAGSLPGTPVHLVKSKPNTPLKTTPQHRTTITVNEIKTPMLPPRMPLSKYTKTPGSVKQQQPSRVPVPDGQTGRASIARLRCQNAGMVMEKAKLFDGLVTTEHDVVTRRQSSRFHVPKTRSFEMAAQQQRTAFTERRDVTKLRAISNHQRLMNSCNSPKNSTPRRRGTAGCGAVAKSPSGVQRRQRLRLVNSPTKNNSSPILKKTLQENFMLSAELAASRKSLAVPPVASQLCSPARSIDSTPLIKRPMLNKSPRRIQLPKTPGRENLPRSTQCTPMKATPLKAMNPHQRRSPRVGRSPLLPTVF